MTVIKGLDRLPGTAIEGMDDELWAQHTQELRERFEAQQETGFAEFAAMFSTRELQTEAMKQHDACGRRMVGGSSGLGPAWTRGEIERPLGTKSMGTWTAAVYTEEQQLRLGVDEQGKPQADAAATTAQPASSRFPAHWGDEPRAQTRDLRPLPGGYGMGSGTLAKWIEDKMRIDAAQGVSAPMTATPKTRWPELVGTAGDSAAAVIRRDSPQLAQVAIVPEDAMVTMDHREDRVRVFVDAAGNVAREPSCG